MKNKQALSTLLQKKIDLIYAIVNYVLSTKTSSCLSFADDRCEKGWAFYGGSCYYREARRKAMKSWENAQKFCESNQANLVTVNDANEQKFLTSLVDGKGSWNGLNNKDDKNVLEWVSGEDSRYTYWAPNEPRKSKKKRCVHMHQAGQELKWKMERCSKKKRFICEKGRLRISSFMFFYGKLGFNHIK